MHGTGRIFSANADRFFGKLVLPGHTRDARASK
jgi:hypothetical protein